MIPIDSRLREHVHLLGELLGSTMREQRGEEFLEKIERIRKGAKAARSGSDDGRQQLTETLNQLSEDELPVATEDEISRYYADHAINAIWEAYKKGEVLKSGRCAWY